MKYTTFIILAVSLISIFTTTLHAAPLTKESAYDIAEAYQMNGVSDAVSGLVSTEIQKEIQGKVKEWTVDAFEEAGFKPAASNVIGGSRNEKLKAEVKKKLKEKLKKHLPEIAKKVLYDKLFMGQFGDEVSEVREMVDRIVSELNVTFNERADQIIEPLYARAMEEMDQYLHYNLGGIVNIDGTDIRGTLNRAIQMDTVENGLTLGLSQVVGESTANGIKKRMEDILAGELPPEAMKYLNMGPDKFAEYASKIKDNLPGKKLDELKDKLLHTPLFIIPNGVYGGILAVSMSRHIALAFQGVPINPYELKRAAEVGEVMVWQLSNKDGLSVDLASLLDAINIISDKFGISLNDLGKLGETLKNAKDELARLEEKVDKLDKLLTENIDKVTNEIKDAAKEVESALKDFQNELFGPLIDAHDKAEKYIDDGRKWITEKIPDELNGIPADWETFKDRYGIDKGIFGEFGEKSPWDYIQDAARKMGVHDAYNKIKEDLKKAADDLNDAVSGALATAGAEVVDAFGFTDITARALGIPDIPQQNPSVENPLDPVLLHSGEFYYHSTDLLVPGRGLDYKFARIYRSGADFKGVMGHNWTHNYEEMLVPLDDRVVHIDAEGKRYIYRCGGGHCKSPPGVFSVLSFLSTEPHYILREPDGRETIFGKTGLMAVKRDRFENALRFEYDKFGRLEKVIDTLGREYIYSYNADGFLSGVKDFSGRTLAFKYDNYSDLVAATGPKTFDFPKGKTIRYGYTTGYFGDLKLNHNLSLIMDPEGAIYLKNVYGEKGWGRDRVIAQQYGAGEKMQISYRFLRAAYIDRFAGKGATETASVAEVKDRRGVLHYYEHNAYGNVLSENYVDEEGKRQAVMKYFYNNDGLRVKASYPGGRLRQFVYNDKWAEQWTRMNLLESKEISADGADVRRTLLEYDPGSIYPRTVTGPNGTKTVFQYENGLISSVEIEGLKGASQKSTYRYYYNSYGQRIAVIDPEGIKTVFNYIPDGAYLASVVEDAEGSPFRNAEGEVFRAVTAFRYDPVGNISAVTNPEGFTTNYTVNSLGQVIEEKSPEPFEYSKKYIFDANDNLVRIKMGGLEYRFHYDEMDNLVQKNEPLGDGKYISTKYEYDPEGRLIRTVFPEGNSREYGYDFAGRLIKIVRGDDSVDRQEISVKYNVEGSPESTINSAGEATSYLYNGFGELREEIDPLGRSHKILRDKAGMVSREEWYGSGSELLSAVEYDYDYQGNVISERRLLFSENDKDGKWVASKMEYGADGLLKTYIDEKENLWQRSYNGLKKVARMALPDGRHIGYRYDLSGRVTSKIEDTAVTVYSYDAMGRLDKILDPLGAERKISYDNRGNMVELMGPLGGRTRFEYDGAGRRTAAFRLIRADEWIATRYEWDGNGRLVSLLDSQNNKASFRYDSLDRIVALDYPDGGIATYQYDSADNLVATKDPNGTTVYQLFDAGRRMVGRRIKRADGVGGTTAQAYYYDGLNRLIYSYDDNDSGNSEDNAENRYYYDSMSNMVAEIQNGREVVRKVNAEGEVELVKYPSSSMVYHQRDSLGRLTGIFGDGRFLAGFDYDEKGHIGAFKTGGGLAGTQSFDPAGRITEQRYDDDLGPFTYQYNDGGKLVLKTIGEAKAALTTSYDYDAAGRLIGLPPALDFSYDRNGNLISDSRFKYFYDGLNRLIEVRKMDEALVAKYAYDVHGRRIMKHQGPDGSRLDYFYNIWDVVEEYKDGRLDRGYVHGDAIDSPVAMIDYGEKEPKRYYYHQDYLGSVAALSDDKGEVVAKYDYQPYGLSTENNLDTHAHKHLRTQPYTFTARRLDPETGLMYYRNRYYSPRTGRFITRDPAGYKTPTYQEGEAITPFHLSFHRRRGLNTYPNNFHGLINDQGWRGRLKDALGVAGFNRLFFRPAGVERTGETDLYAYAGFDPVNHTDPMGLDYLWVTGEYKPYDKPGTHSGRYADLQIIWVEERTDAGVATANVKLPAYHAVSGPWGNGALPSGDYEGYYLQPRSESSMSINNFGWSLHINPPRAKVDSLLRIHPDGPEYFGSRGCIAIDEEGNRDLHDRLLNYLGGYRKGKVIDVHVSIREAGESRSSKDGDLDMYIRSQADFLSSINWH